MTVKSLSNYTGDAGFRSPEQCLRDCLEDLGKRGAFKDGKKLLVLCLDDTQGEYHISFSQAGMRMSECISLLEIAKPVFLHEMGYALWPEDVGL